MYNARIVNDNGTELCFGVENFIVFDIIDMGGIPVNIGTAQALSQIGETVLNQSVGGIPMMIRGVIFENIVSLKNAIRKMFAPFNSGEIFINEYKLRWYTKTSPLFNTQKNDGRFTIQIYAPTPYWSKINDISNTNKKIFKKFSFPTKYSPTHQYGATIYENLLTIINNGDVRTPFSCEISTLSTITNFKITQANTSKKLEFVGSLNYNEKIEVYRDIDGLLRVDKIDENGIEDAISMLTDDSDLVDLEVGENMFSTYSEGDGKVIVNITFNEMVGAMYEY